MESADPFETFVRTGLERFGLVPDDVDLAVIRAADGIYGPQIEALMAADLEHVADEPDLDLSRAPERA
jgi:hypothetical protein